MILKRLKCSERVGRRERDVLQSWMSESNNLLGELFEFEEFSPFHDNEIAAVGVLLGGAARARYSAAIEYSVRKRSKLDGRRWKDGRVDLWFCAMASSFSFEFKLYNPDRVWPKSLNAAIDESIWDMKRVDDCESDAAFGVAIAPNYRTDISDQVSSALRRNDVDCVYRIDNGRVLHAHLFFARVR